MNEEDDKKKQCECGRGERRYEIRTDKDKQICVCRHCFLEREEQEHKRWER